MIVKMIETPQPLRCALVISWYNVANNGTFLHEKFQRKCVISLPRAYLSKERAAMGR